MLDDARPASAVPVSALADPTDLVVEGAEPPLTVRLETSAGALVDPDLRWPASLPPDHRLVLTLPDRPRFTLALLPDDFPRPTGRGAVLDGAFYFATLGFGPDRPDPTPYLLLVTDGFGTPLWWRAVAGGSYDFRPAADGSLTGHLQLVSGQPRQGARLDPVGGEVLGAWDPLPRPDWDQTSNDPHELWVYADGSRLEVITGQDTQDLRAVGGAEDGQVQPSALRETNAAGEIVAEWLAFVEDFTALPPASLAAEAEPAPWRWTHINSVDPHPDGWLLSLRTANEVIWVDRATLQVRWRLGGANSDFRFVNDPGFYGQHSARWLPGDRVMVFDNRTNFGSPPTGDARWVEYALADGEATRVAEYAQAGLGGVAFTGSVQRLPDGRTLIGWGTAGDLPDGTRAPDLTLLDPAGGVQAELAFPRGIYSYRAWYSPFVP